MTKKLILKEKWKSVFIKENVRDKLMLLKHKHRFKSINAVIEYLIKMDKLVTKYVNKNGSSKK